MAPIKKPSGILSIILFSLLSLVNFIVMAQNEVAIGSTTTKSNAILWLNGNGSQGLILPVVTSKSAVSNPDKGMIVYDDSDNKVWYRSNSAWVEVGSGSSGGANDNLNLSIQGNQLLLRDGTTVLSSIAIASGTQTTDAFMVFQNGAWQFASINDISRSGGNLQVTGIRGKSVATLPATTQALVYDPGANSGNGGWTFQPLSGASGITSVSGTAPITVINPTTTPTISLANAGITNALLADNAVNAAKVQDGTLTGADLAASTITGTNIAGTTITADKLAQSGAASGQVLKWNGTNWVPQADNTGASIPTLTNGQLLTNNGTNDIAVTMSGDATFASTGALTIANNAITTAKIANTAVDATKLADNSVTSAKIVNASITGADIAATTITGSNIAGTTITADKLAASGAAAGQVLKWNGTNWVPQDDDAGIATPVLTNGQILTGNGTINSATSLSGDATLSGGTLTISNNAITTAKINANAVDATKLADNAVTSAKITDGTITGADVAATTITADKLAASGAAAGQVLKWNGTNWVPQADDTGTSIPALANGQLLTNNGTNDIAVTMSGDATFNSTGALTISNNAVTTAKLADNSVTSAKIVNATVTGADIAATTITGANIAATTITADKIAQSGAANNQVLQWNGTNWVPATQNFLGSTLNSTQLFVGNASNVATAVTMSGDATISNTGALTIANNAITSAKISDGSVTGTDIAATTVTGANIAGTTITADKLAGSGATNGQVLKWNGTNWVPQDDNSGAALPALAAGQLVTNDGTNDIAVTMSGDATFNSTGALTIANNAVTTTKLADNSVTSLKIVNGTVTGADIAATTITGANIAATTITADKLAQSGATNNQVLQWNGTNWVPATQNFLGSTLNSTQLFVGNASNVATAVTMSGDATISNTGALTIANNAITTAKIANTAVDATKLADNAVTTTKINAGAVDNTKLADNAVTSIKIADGTIASSDLSSFGAIAAGQILQWNGTSWAAAILPATPVDVTTQTGVLVGDGTTITGTTAGAGVRGILGSSNNTIGWVTGTPNQILGTNASGDLQFADQSAFVSSTLNSSQILVGNASNTATAVTISGDASLSNTGVLTIANSAITSAKIADASITGTDIAATTITGANIAATTITADKLAQSGAVNNQVLQWNGTNWIPATQNFVSSTLNSAQLLVGNASNVATAVTMSGDATVGNTGALTIVNNAITSAKIADASISGTDIAASTITGNNIASTTITADKLAQSGATNDQVLQWNGTNWVPASLVADFTTLNIIPKGNGSGMVASQIFDNGTNLGIGTVTPGAKLDIIGTVKITDGTQAAGRVLTSDANGLASWQPAGAGSGWTLTGNGTTVDGTNFIGTTNNVPLSFRVNNEASGKIDQIKQNAFFGYRSGRNITSTVGFGDRNAALGDQAMSNSTFARSNVAIGYTALLSNRSASSNTAIGRGALNTLGTAYNPGGTDFDTNNTAVGYQSLYNTDTDIAGSGGDFNTAIGYNTGQTNTTGDRITLVGASANVSAADLTNATAIGFGASVNANNKVRIGNGSVSVIEGNVGFTAASDRRLKNEIQEINFGIDLIKKLKPVSYILKDSDGRKSWGFIAQDIEELIGTDKAVLTIGQDDMRTLGLRYTDFIAPMVKAIQEQQGQIEALKAQLKDKDEKVIILESSVNSMKEELETIKRALGMEASTKSSSKN